MLAFFASVAEAVAVAVKVAAAFGGLGSFIRGILPSRLGLGHPPPVVQTDSDSM